MGATERARLCSMTTARRPLRAKMVGALGQYWRGWGVVKDADVIHTPHTLGPMRFGRGHPGCKLPLTLCYPQLPLMLRRRHTGGDAASLVRTLPGCPLPKGLQSGPEGGSPEGSLPRLLKETRERLPIEPALGGTSGHAAR